MRKVFSSQRLENVERVAELLRAEGIAVKIENGRSYRSSRRSNFSYDSRRMPEDLPSVWIMHSEDQPRGRQLLRDLGLLESTRDPAASYLPSARHDAGAAGKAGLFTAKRLKLGLLLAITGGIALIVYVSRTPTPPAPAIAAAPTPAPGPTITPAIALTDVQVFRIDVPTALAAKLVGKTLTERKPAQACLRIDGGDPSEKLLQALPATSTKLFPASTCPDGDALGITVQDYMTDGSGSGDVTLVVGSRTRSLQVERTGTRWQVLGTH